MTKCLLSKKVRQTLRLLDPSTVSHNFTGVIRQAGLPYLNFHGMRHTHASILIANGVDIKTVSARLGHASTSFTLDTYGHLLPGNPVAAEKFDQVVISELVRDPDGEEEDTGSVPVSNVSKMLAKGDENPSKKGGFETEPHRNRTCNLLIKSHDPYLLPGNDYSHPVSDIQKYSRDLCLAFYLLLSSVAKLVGKMLATALRLRR